MSFSNDEKEGQRQKGKGKERERKKEKEASKTEEESLRYYDELILQPSANPRVAYAYLKHLWHSGERNVAYTKLEDFTKKLQYDNVDTSLLARYLNTFEINHDKAIHTQKQKNKKKRKKNNRRKKEHEYRKQ